MNEKKVNELITIEGTNEFTTINMDLEGLKEKVDQYFTYSPKYKKYYPGYEKILATTPFYTLEIKISLNQDQYNSCKGIITEKEGLNELLKGLDPTKWAMIESILKGSTTTTPKKRAPRKQA